MLLCALEEFTSNKLQYVDSDMLFLVIITIFAGKKIIWHWLVFFCSSTWSHC